MSKSNFPPRPLLGQLAAASASASATAAHIEHAQKELRGRCGLLQAELAELDWEAGVLDTLIQDGEVILATIGPVSDYSTPSALVAIFQLKKEMAVARHRRPLLLKRRDDVQAVLTEMERELSRMESGVVPVVLK